MARAAVVYVRDWKQTGSIHSRDAAFQMLRGLTYLQTGDIRTRYRQWGTTGTPIVLVHGFIESADTWQPTASRLAAAGHRVYALDLDGWGYSQRVAPFFVTPRPGSAVITSSTTPTM